jgi:cyclopropane-fatty-acyl-phospholipid synthase
MQVADAFSRLLGEGTPVRLVAYDGSTSGPADAESTVELRSTRALNYLLTSPGQLGIGRAYVAGDLEVHGDMYTAMRTISEVQFGNVSWSERLDLLRNVGLGRLRPVAPPPEEIRRTGLGLRHSKARDAGAISHHYDVSNRFYEYVLGPTMAYTCAVFPTPDATLEQAQEEKFDLVCRKLDLKPGMRLLDVGSGWGGMVMHAAKHYGVTAIGATLSRQQAEWAQKAIADAGLSDRAEVRHSDYRDVPETGFDAVSSIGLSEHIGHGQLPSYFGFLYSKLRPQGRLLNHSILRPTNKEPIRVPRGFINRYVFPDGELTGMGRLASIMQDSGFEVRHEENLREHYAMTLAHWCANLEANWDAAVTEVGLGRARVWRVYMAGSQLAFEQNRIQLHQLLGVRPDDDGRAGFPLRPDFARRTAPAAV